MMANTRVTHTTDGDVEVLKWGTDGAEHRFRPGDDEGMRKAYRGAIAEGIAAGAQIFDEVERSIARELQEGIGITFAAREPGVLEAGLKFNWEAAIRDPRVRKDAADTLLIGWFPTGEVADQIAACGGSGIGANSVVGNTGFPLHLTLLYLGDPDADGTNYDVQLVSAVTKIFSTQCSPLDGCISGLGRFVGPEDTDCIVALVDIPGLGQLRHSLKDQLCYQAALPYNSPLYNEQHGFVPHITLAWVPKSQASPAPLTETIPLCVNSVTVAQGQDSVTFSLGWTGANAGYGENASPAAEPYFAARESYVLAKAGRVLSAKNLKALQEAHAAMGKVIDSAAVASVADAEANDAPGDGDPLADEQAATTKRREFLAAVAGASPAEFAVEYLVTKSTPDERFTLGPLYAPGRKDAHGEHTAAETLQKAVWDFVQSKFDAGDNRLNLQHGDLGEIQVANMLEVMAWPYEHDITVKAVGGEERTLTMPAGTVYLGARWDEDAWPLVTKGKLNGWSLGGKAIRVSTPELALDHMGDKHAASTHKFVGDSSECAICGKGYESGSHYGNKADSGDGDSEAGNKKARALFDAVRGAIR